MKNGLYVDEDGTKKWWSNDKLHREDGPAVEFTFGDKHWYLNGKLHREGGPAVEHINGYKEWHLNGKLHRGDGPAIETTIVDKVWYLNGERLKIIPKEVLLNYTKTNNLTLAHLLIDPDPLIRESAMKYKWEEVV